MSPRPPEVREEYVWGTTFRLDAAFKRTKESAALVVAELQRIQGNQECLDPKDVVQSARNPTSPLHSAFTWDVEKAASLYNIEQARDLQRGPRKVTVVIDHGTGVERRTVPVPVYASYVAEGERGYREVAVAVSDFDHNRALLDEARRQLAGFRTRYAGLQELQELGRQIDTFLEGGSSLDEAA